MDQNNGNNAAFAAIAMMAANDAPTILGFATALIGVANPLSALGLTGLNMVGFTADGIRPNSFAAAAQSLYYGGETSGIFSNLQRFAARRGI